MVRDTSPLVQEVDLRIRAKRVMYGALKPTLLNYKSTVEKMVQRVLDNPSTSMITHQLELLNIMQSVNESIAEVTRALDSLGGEMTSAERFPASPPPPPSPGLEGNALLASIQKLKMQQSGSPAPDTLTALERVKGAVAVANANAYASRPSDVRPMQTGGGGGGGGGVPEGRRMALPPSLLQPHNPTTPTQPPLPAVPPPQLTTPVALPLQPQHAPPKAELLNVSSQDLSLLPGDCAWYCMDEESTPAYARVVEAKRFSGSARAVLYTVKLVATNAERAVEGDMLYIRTADVATLRRRALEGDPHRRGATPPPPPPPLSSHSRSSSMSSYTTSSEPQKADSEDEEEEVFCVPFRTEAKPPNAPEATPPPPAEVPNLPTPSAVVEGPLPPPVSGKKEEGSTRRRSAAERERRARSASRESRDSRDRLSRREQREEKREQRDRDQSRRRRRKSDDTERSEGGERSRRRRRGGAEDLTPPRDNRPKHSDKPRRRETDRENRDRKPDRTEDRRDRRNDRTERRERDRRDRR